MIASGRMLLGTTSCIDQSLKGCLVGRALEKFAGECLWEYMVALVNAHHSYGAPSRVRIPLFCLATGERKSNSHFSCHQLSGWWRMPEELHHSSDDRRFDSGRVRNHP
jgi:hypothetical protein